MSRGRLAVSSSPLRRLATVAGVIGWWRTLLAAPLWLLVQRYVLLRRELDLPLDPPLSCEIEVGWSWLQPREIDELVAVDSSLAASELSSRLARQDECLIGRRDRRLVHYRWHGFGRVPLGFFGVDLELDAHTVYCSSVFTVPAERGRGLHHQSSRVALTSLSERGITASVCGVAWWNRPSLKVSESQGYRRVGSVTRVGLGRISFLVVSGAMKKTGARRLSF